MEHSNSHTKKAVSRCSDTQDRKLSRPCIHSRVDMNMITQLRFDYVCDVQTLLQSTVATLTQRTSLHESLLHVLQHKALKSVAPKRQFWLACVIAISSEELATWVF